MAGRPLRRARMNPARTIDQFLASLTPKQVKSIRARVDKVIMENGGYEYEYDSYDGEHIEALAEALVLTHRGMPITMDNLTNLEEELNHIGAHEHPEYDPAWEWSARYYRR